MSEAQPLQLSFTQSLLYATPIFILAYAIYRFYIHPNYVSSIRNLPGPKNESLWSGNLGPIFKAEAGAWHESKVAEYGHVLMYRGMFGSSRLYLSDPRALSHILVKRSYDYPKPAQTRGFLKRIFGEGILFAEGNDHVRQRRIMNEPFTQKHVNTYKTVFDEHAIKLRGKLVEEVNRAGNESSDGSAIIDVIGWLARCTCDVIGVTGFGYKFNALDDPNGELATATGLLVQPRGITVTGIMLQLMTYYIPFLSIIPNERAEAVRRASTTLKSVAQKIIQERKEMALNGQLKQGDLISRLIVANTESTNPKDQMTDEELSGQVITFLLAGHETSSTTLTWILMRLSKHRDVQEKLRAELAQAAGNGSVTDLSADELSQLKYLDAVVRETLRFDTPVTATLRSASKEDVIPLGRSLRGRDGKTDVEHIHVKKGQQIMVGISTFNRSKELYGDDADQYRPERFMDTDILEEKQELKGFTYGLATFISGARGCIGYRFALLEIKSILAVLVMAFDIAERDANGTDFIKRSSIVTRPVIASELDAGAQMPVRLRCL